MSTTFDLDVAQSMKGLMGTMKNPDKALVTLLSILPTGDIAKLVTLFEQATSLCNIIGFLKFVKSSVPLKVRKGNAMINSPSTVSAKSGLPFIINSGFFPAYVAFLNGDHVSDHTGDIQAKSAVHEEEPFFVVPTKKSAPKPKPRVVIQVPMQVDSESEESLSESEEEEEEEVKVDKVKPPTVIIDLPRIVDDIVADRRTTRSTTRARAQPIATKSSPPSPTSVSASSSDPLLKIVPEKFLPLHPAGAKCRATTKQGARCVKKHCDSDANFCTQHQKCIFG